MKLVPDKVELSNAVEENRIINLGDLAKFIRNISVHSSTCSSALAIGKTNEPPVVLEGVQCDRGLATFLKASCQGCLTSFFTKPERLNLSTKHYKINAQATWGECVRGGGASSLGELMSTIGIPSIGHTTFVKIEHCIGEWWLEALKQEMLAAGQQERRIAVEKGNFQQGVPYISVILDGGWSKRSHKHTYNALAGVAIIIGKETGRILFMGVRNKYCLICRIAEGKGEKAKEHVCTGGYMESSQKMESDILLEGFCEAESRHGVRYLQVIGDGDSSLMHRLVEEGPAWCKDITKIECANHICKGA